MAGSFNFTREVIKDVIILYEQYPEIYNSNLPEYKNRNIRQDRLNKITAELNTKYPGVTVQNIQLKLKNLRTQYFHELNKYKKSVLSGSGKDDLYKPSWWCFEYLMFLSVGNPIEQGESNLPCTDTQRPDVEEHAASEAGSQLLFDGTIQQLINSEVLIESSESRPKKTRYESPTPGTGRDTTSDCDLGLNPVSLTTPLASKGKKRTRKNNSSEDITGSLLKEATEAVRSMNYEQVDLFESFALNLVGEMRRIKNPKIVNTLKRKFINEIYDILEEQDD